jgi:hypothetical protein
LRLRPALALIAFVVAVLGASSANAVAAPLSISVSGNHFVNGDGQTVRLLGANHPSFEYACQEGYAYNDGHMDDADAAVLASWHVTAVRVPLNEDCWLGINGLPSNSQAPDPPLTQSGYQQAVEQYVAALNAHGLYAILDLHWTAPSTYVADGQRPMPDSHSVNFWESVATTFKANHAVVFDIFNEPYSPANVNDPAHPVDWNCWRDGGCALSVSNDQSPPDSHVYQAIGMQTLVNAVRGTGATQPVLVGGLDYANDLTQWVDHAPDDPLNQEAASFHNYQGKPCDNAACWNSTIASVAANVPVVTGEFDQDVCAPSTFDADYMNWADQHGVGYLAWGWWVLTQQEITDAGCSAFYLLTSYDGTPAAPNGTALHDHLAALAAGGPGGPGTPGGSGTPGGKSSGGPKLKSFSARVRSRGASVAFVLRSAENAKGTLRGRTAKKFRTRSRAHRRRVSLGSVRFKLKANVAKTVVLKLSKASRTLLRHKRKLKVGITITLRGAGSKSTVAHRAVTLKLPRRK